MKGDIQEVSHSMLPGYIFLYPEEPLKKLIWFPGVIRTLGNGELNGADLAFAMMVLEHNGVIGTIRLAEEGNHFTVADSLWKTMGGNIVKVDRGRKRCCVEYKFDDVQHTVWLGYDIILPIHDEKSM